MTTTIANANAATKREIRDICIGENSRTVGAGGDFDTIADALTWLATQTPYDAVDIGALTCDIAQYANRVDFSGPVIDIIKPGDLLYLDSDPSPIYGALGAPTEHWYPIIDSGGQGTTDYSVTIACSLAGPAKSTYAPLVYRPRKYLILLLPGTHLIQNPSILDGCDLTIAGIGKSAVIQRDPAMVGGSSGMYSQTYGYLTLQSLYGSHCSIIKAGPNTSAFPNLDEGFSFVTMSDIQVSSEGSPYNGMTLAGLVAADVVIHSSADHCYIPYSDYLVVNNWTSRIDESTEALLIGSPVSRPGSSHRKTIKGVTAHRYPSVPYRNGQDFAVNINGGGLYTDCVMDISEFTIIDNIGSATDDYTNLYINASNGANSGVFTLNVTNALLQATDPNHTAHIQTNGTDYVANFRNVKDENGKQVTVKSGSGSGIRWLDCDAHGDIVFAASVTPDVYDGHHLKVGQLTGSITINAPTGDVVQGERLALVFEQDGTGGRVITWNAAFKVHTNPTGGASEKSVYDFEYDGTHWVQVNTTAWA